MLANYSFVNDDVMAYFKRRLSQAPRDATFALEFIKENARTREAQEACVAAVASNATCCGRSSMRSIWLT